MISFIFGIEPTLFKQISNTEQKQWRAISYLYLLLVSIAVISGGYLSYMIYPSIFPSILTGLVLGFIILNMLRFSLCSVERPIDHDESTSLMNKKGLVKYFIFMVLATFLALPFSSLILKPINQEKLKSHKIQVHEKYMAFLDMSKNKSLMFYDNKIKELLNLISDGVNVDVNTSRLHRLENEKAEYLAIISNRNTEKSKTFKKTIQNAQFPLFQFKSSASNPIGMLIILLVNVLFYRILKRTYDLVYNPKFDYALLATHFHYELVKKESELNKVMYDEILLEKYNYKSV